MAWTAAWKTCLPPWHHGYTCQATVTMPMRRWTIRYRIGTSPYYSRIVEAHSQADAHRIFAAEMPDAQRCGSAQPVRDR